VIEKLNATINEGLRSPEMRDHLARIGIEPIITTPREFGDIIAEEIPKWAAIVRATGIRIAE
jgi:tripartite-type tricarboxylate transporter receptor subunit TctC